MKKLLKLNLPSSFISVAPKECKNYNEELTPRDLLFGFNYLNKVLDNANK